MSPSISGPPDFSSPCAGGIFSVGWRLYCFFFFLPPPPPLGRCFSAPAFAGMPCFAQSSSRVPAAWHLLTLVSRVASSLAAGAFFPGGWVDLSSCYMRNSLVAGFCDSGLRLRFCTTFRTRLRRVEATVSSFILVSVVSSWHELLFHI